MSSTLKLWAQVDEAGRLVISSEEVARFGLSPGAKVLVEASDQDMRLHHPVNQLAKIYIEPSACCNLDCRTCLRNVWQAPNEIMAEVTFDRITEDLAAFSPIPTIFFGGLGEPLTHPKLAEMVARAKGLGARVEMITNGTILGQRISRQLIEAGLDFLWVSLDGATPEGYADVRLGASLPAVLANVKRFSQLRPPAHYPAPEIGIVFVAMKRNIADLPLLMRIGQQVGATHFLVSNVLPYTAELQAEVLYSRVSNDITYLSSPRLPQLSLPKLATNGVVGRVLDQVMGQGWNISFAGHNLGLRNDHCPFIESGSMSVGWDGSVSPCLPLLHDHMSFLNDRERFVHHYTVGKVTEQSLKELWLSPEYTAFRERVQLFDFSPCTFCGGCDLSPENKEDCFGNTFPTCGGCLWAQGVIQCP